MKQPRVTICICTYNDSKTIERVVQGVVDIRYPYKEIIVINDHSTDTTPDILSRFSTRSDVRIIHNSENLGLAGSMNVGARAATGEFVTFVESDCLVTDPDWLNKMLSPFSDPSVGCVVSQRVIRDHTELTRAESVFDAIVPSTLINTTENPLDLDYFRGKADVYPKKLLEELGFWDNNTFFLSGEDVDLSEKMKLTGYRIVLSPDASIEYLFSSRQDSLAGILKKGLLYGRSAVPLYKRHRYDGLKARFYALTVVTILLLPLVLFFSLADTTAGTVLGTVTIAHLATIKAGRGMLPLGGVMLLPALMLCAALSVSFYWSVLIVAGLYMLYTTVKPCTAWLRERERTGNIVLLFIMSLLWRCCLGTGYLLQKFRVIS